MTVEVLTIEKCFPNFDMWQSLEKHIDNVKNKTIKLLPVDRGNINNNILEDCKDHNIAVNAKFTNFVRDNDMLNLTNGLARSLRQNHLDANIFLRNASWYEAGDYMGWHTNKYSEGLRYYLVWAEEENKTHFDYIDADGNTASVTAPKGWSVNKFTCTGESNPFVHQVRAECNRMVFGFLVR